MLTVTPHEAADRALSATPAESAAFPISSDASTTRPMLPWAAYQTTGGEAMTSSLEVDRPDVDALARQTGFTGDAVASMIRSFKAGSGRMAQFDHREFGGAGQWMQGGMLMISDFSNRDLHQRVGRLCEAIARHVPDDELSTPTATYQRQSQSADGVTHVQDSHASRSWWPASWGRPDTSGAQNDMRYAWFSRGRRLAIDVGGTVTLYDTGDHRIAGVSQQQGRDRSLAFTSQHGPVDLSDLSVVRNEADEAQPDAFEALEKLAALHARGILTDDEFATKKAELLGRL